ncbi:MAG: DNA repair protein RadC [Candidatus Pseudobacter hemicellulosilyticus]|uniref:DNA repair protein RadC n=1 Tax=Candidatus Pseudobacter hemicellulosilyticus TaxID=3121375 RepID=A0AAJ5WUC1_9BACT|nr:MAG: DNA repair protein RadC [Pseudobacter sp.]
MQEKKYHIKNWAAGDRPREKLLSKSPMALSDSELLAILINHGTTGRSALDLAQDVLRLGDDNLRNLGKLPLAQLTRIRGIGKAKAVTIAAALELGRRRQGALPPPRYAVSSSKDVVHYLQSVLADRSNEALAVVFLNQANHIKHFTIISEGGLTSTIVDIRIILKKALEVNSLSLILCHNHPSGNCQPSAADHAITSRVKDAASLLDIRLLDHLIVTEENYYSFADQGLL